MDGKLSIERFILNSGMIYIIEHVYLLIYSNININITIVIVNYCYMWMKRIAFEF